jgi:transposase
MRYSNDLRERFVKLLEEGKTINEISGLLDIATDTLYIWNRKFKAGTLFKVIAIGGRPITYDYAALEKFVEEFPDKYIREIKTELFESNNQKASMGGIHKALKKLNLKLKKKSSYSKKETMQKENNTN